MCRSLWMQAHIFNLLLFFYRLVALRACSFLFSCPCAWRNHVCSPGISSVSFKFLQRSLTLPSDTHRKRWSQRTSWRDPPTSRRILLGPDVSPRSPPQRSGRWVLRRWSQTHFTVTLPVGDPATPLPHRTLDDTQGTPVSTTPAPELELSTASSTPKTALIRCQVMQLFSSKSSGSLREFLTCIEIAS